MSNGGRLDGKAKRGRGAWTVADGGEAARYSALVPLDGPSV
jgi:hypothetical protein